MIVQQSGLRTRGRIAESNVEKYATCARYCKNTPEPQNLFHCYEACRHRHLDTSTGGGTSTSSTTTYVTHTTYAGDSSTSVTVHSNSTSTSNGSTQTFVFPDNGVSSPGCKPHSSSCTVYTSGADRNSTLVSANITDGGSATATVTTGNTTSCTSAGGTAVRLAKITQSQVANSLLSSEHTCFACSPTCPCNPAVCNHAVRHPTAATCAGGTSTGVVCFGDVCEDSTTSSPGSEDQFSFPGAVRFTRFFVLPLSKPFPSMKSWG